MDWKFVSVNLVWLVVGVVTVVLVHLGWTWWRLKHIPGPFPACITDLHRMSWVPTARAHLILQDAHRKYGEVVRIGPNMVSFSNPEAIPAVYPMRPGIPKGDFYATLRPYTRSGGALHAVFNTTEEDILKQIKSPIAPLFNLSSTVTFEPLVDQVLQCIQNKFDQTYCATEQVINMGQWLQFFAFDVMGTMTFSKRYGFLDQGKDVGGMLATIIDFMRTSAPMTQSPFLDRILRKNIIADILRQAFRPTPSLSILSFVAQAIKEKTQKLEAEPDKAPNNHSHTDFLTRYIQLQKGNPNIPAWAPTAWTFSNVIAGSDSVGTIMRTVLFNLLAYPNTMHKLRQELENANPSRPFPRYSEVRDLPYLDACVLEAARVHPPFALPFERVIPRGGLTVLGHYLPEGTVIGGNPYVVNRDPNTFGDDAEFWRPERWLEGDSAHKRHLEASMLTFGAGRRVCLGRHVGILEIKKLIPFLVLTYDMRLVDKEKFQVENSWFFIQRGFYAQIQKRHE
ncbi:Benzoate 4-monooxygenase cytochrome P450 [Penicillium samsonianum]|uniref:Benzoate 4-monooxygenase cytochrome P450 n=1 Tax=Penicillium samsonianum TaxID=1882272 RepID=UPI0025474639|nr:Benzoate 4-monooxygenase cytochrome P450 [Penicillium samsonianum]KAJ6133407.1 Benzoate 4-monooxygenase cytochrome P450 [Penicillium samsonianum]